MLPIVMIGNLVVDTLDAAVTSGKVEAAMALAASLSERYRYASTFTRDSIVRAERPNGTGITVMEAADILRAQYVAFLSVRRLQHIVRAEVVLRNVHKPADDDRGIGYAALHFHHVDESVLADPAILSAVQQAMAVALNDSAMFALVDSGMRARPTMLTAVGGITFENDPTLLPWDLFKERVTASYDMVETIVHEMLASDKFTVIDVETRDTLYALFGLHMIENYSPVTAIELSFLHDFDVTRLITGTVRRTLQGASLRLALNRVDANGRYTELHSTTQVVADDTKDAIRKAVVQAVMKLLADV